MSKIKIALLQLMPGKSLQENTHIGMEACRKAKIFGADIALFPEMWSIGYELTESISEVKSKAIDKNDKFIRSFSDLAKELQIAIGITFLEKYEHLPRNSICMFDRFGKEVYTYAKVHTCDFGEEKVLQAGNDFYVSELDTLNGIIKIGSMICYDREFPESARILMLKGAEIILVPNACPMEINRISQLRARAFENMVGIATVNYPKGKPDCNGHSTAFDGIAYKPTEPCSRDTLIIEAGEEEGIYPAVFDIDELRNYREREVHGNAYRQPNKYGILVSEEKHEPFIRKDYRRLAN
ncbi:carbon-nitrogen hydrolase family protein [Treponema pedis]|uniref:carbon-nitrogen hydrolase family protein n=1 Tax=Treponema pedis TaxID=409322 RepID=UPI00197E58CD|nr:carbon-nitrogen hydrolase family protein [Treponema pedis]QSI04986.1 carbon-nitrogen hydrolase family protein [Treponema pedis]